MTEKLVLITGVSSGLGRAFAQALGIFVTAIEPGMFRTDWAGRSMVRAERTIPDYDAVFDPIREARAARSGGQPGDPARAGRAIVTLLESADPPAHLLLGPDALEYVRKDLEALQAEFAAWEQVTRSTNFDPVAGGSTVSQTG